MPNIVLHNVIPCIKKYVAEFSGEDLLIWKYYSLPKEEKIMIDLWLDGINGYTARHIKKGKRTHKNVGQLYGWSEYEAILKNRDRLQKRYEELKKQQEKFDVVNNELVDNYGAVFDEMYVKILDNDMVYFDLLKCYFERPNIVKLANCQVDKMHACTECKIMLRLKFLKLKIIIINPCDCDTEELFEFELLPWQL